MPAPGKQWWHLTIGTHGSWLPGDPRGFRSRQHRIHSSGDHRNPPPPGEHLALHQFTKATHEHALVIPPPMRATLGTAMVERFEKQNHRLLILAIGAMHVHALAELPSDYATSKKQVGTIKRVASLKLRNDLPGQIWADGCGLKPIDDQQHQQNTYRYILKHRDEGAWVWTFREEA